MKYSCSTDQTGGNRRGKRDSKEEKRLHSQSTEVSYFWEMGKGDGNPRLLPWVMRRAFGWIYCTAPRGMELFHSLLFILQLMAVSAQTQPCGVASWIHFWAKGNAWQSSLAALLLFLLLCQSNWEQQLGSQFRGIVHPGGMQVGRSIGHMCLPSGSHCPTWFFFLI